MIPNYSKGNYILGTVYVSASFRVTWDVEFEVRLLVAIFTISYEAWNKSGEKRKERIFD